MIPQTARYALHFRYVRRGLCQSDACRTCDRADAPAANPRVLCFAWHFCREESKGGLNGRAVVHGCLINGAVSHGEFSVRRHRVMKRRVVQRNGLDIKNWNSKCYASDQSNRRIGMS